MHEVKICPSCAAEYFPHIENCADCGDLLISPGELQKAEDERKRCMDQELEARVVVREGELKWMKELYHVLIDSGIPCAINADGECGKGCCGGRDRLMVSSRDIARANERIDEYYTEIHPEIQASRELASEGRCPACSSPVAPDAPECPDCGLTLFVVE